MSLFNNFNPCWKKFVVFAFLLVIVTASCMVCPASSAEFESSAPCPILCSGEILKEVQLARIFNSSSYFVHTELLAAPNVIQSEFEKLKNQSKELTPSVLKNFVDRWFGPPGSDLETATPSDWLPNPRFVELVHDKQLREWLLELNQIWKILMKKTPLDVERNAQAYTQVYLPNPFVVPGGLFTEIYYWDTYWIVEGLLLCEMQDSAKNMIQNLLYLVNKFGYVPNGSRRYYLGRSQIPFLIPMLAMYERYTKDYLFVEDNVDLMKQEFDYWLDNNAVSFNLHGMNYTLFRYLIESNEPRPESYYQDFTHARNSSVDEAKHFNADIRAAAESGWDFSSRWFVNENGRTNNIEDINTHVILPVDLNSLICYNGHILSNIFARIGDGKLAKQYKDMSSVLNYTISRLLWDEGEGFWFDFNLKTKKLEKDFYASSFMPLWTRTYGAERNGSYIIGKVLTYIARQNLTAYPGGLPTSLRNSGQQWDFPNGWAPLNYIAILGLRDAAMHNASAGEVARELANKWVLNNYYTYRNSSPHQMFEKYDVSRVGVPGSGGEYPVQAGFGWTNGVVMALLSVYPRNILTRRDFDYGAVAVGVLLLAVMVGCLGSFAYTRIRAPKHSGKLSTELLNADFHDSLLEDIYSE